MANVITTCINCLAKSFSPCKYIMLIHFVGLVTCKYTYTNIARSTLSWLPTLRLYTYVQVYDEYSMLRILKHKFPAFERLYKRLMLNDVCNGSYSEKDRR